MQCLDQLKNNNLNLLPKLMPFNILSDYSKVEIEVHSRIKIL